MSLRGQAYISNVRQNVRQLWEALNNLKAAQREWNALDYGTTLEDGIGGNVGLTKTEVVAAVFATPDAIVVLLNQGHGTNLAKLL